MAQAKTVSPAERQRQLALDALADLGGRTITEDDLLFEGRKVILPASMRTIREGIQFLERKEKEAEQTFSFTRTFKYRPKDGAVATGNAIRKAFGISVGKPIISFFGRQPPELMDVEVNLNEYVQAPWGCMTIPGLEGLEIYLMTDRDKELGIVFQLNVEGPKKYRGHVEGLFRLIEEELRTNSIYRGKAINGAELPGFLDLSSVDPDSVVYSDEVLAQLNANVWSPIKNADTLRKLGESGKRAVLFEGKYGTGKTLAAYLTAQIAVAQGWTFIMVRPGKDDLEQVIQTARMYEPACVFYEDLDTVATPEFGESDQMSKVLDMFDGLDAKNLRMLLVLTTNKVEELHPGMMRPGRLDAVISIGSLDRNGVEKLTRYVLQDKLASDVDWDAVHESMEGYLPAFIREVLTRTKLYSIANHGEMRSVGTVELVSAAQGLRTQWQMQQDANAVPAKPDLLDLIEDRLDQLFTGRINETRLVDQHGNPARGERLEITAGD